MVRPKTPWLLQYSQHQRNAQMDGKPFHLSFEEWLSIWVASGHLHERGFRRGQYVMARFGDVGAYEVGNVRIITAEANCRERRASVETRRKMSESRKRNLTSEVRAHLSVLLLGNKNAAGSKRTPAERACISEFMKGNQHARKYARKSAPA